MICINGWYFLTRPSRVRGWMAMAKREPFETTGDSIREPGDLWFEFGPTEGEALAAVKRGVFRLGEAGRIDIASAKAEFAR